MDALTQIQKAIDYIEANITEDLDFCKISAQAYMSSFHF